MLNNFDIFYYYDVYSSNDDNRCVDVCCTWLYYDYDVVKSMPLKSFPDPFRFFWSNVDRVMYVQLQRL